MRMINQNQIKIQINGERPGRTKRLRETSYLFKVKGSRVALEKKFPQNQIRILQAIFKILSEKSTEEERNQKLSVFDKKMVDWVITNNVIGFAPPTAKKGKTSQK